MADAIVAADRDDDNNLYYALDAQPCVPRCRLAGTYRQRGVKVRARTRDTDSRTHPCAAVAVAAASHLCALTRAARAHTLTRASDRRLRLTLVPAVAFGGRGGRVGGGGGRGRRATCARACGRRRCEANICSTGCRRPGRVCHLPHVRRRRAAVHRARTAAGADSRALQGSCVTSIIMYRSRLETLELGGGLPVILSARVFSLQSQQHGFGVAVTRVVRRILFFFFNKVFPKSGHLNLKLTEYNFFDI